MASTRNQLRENAVFVAVVVALVVALVGATVGVAMLLTSRGLHPTAACFFGAAVVAAALGMYGECYQRWARAFWGAPFRVGDRVRVVRGPDAGREATVVGLGQGVEVDVEIDGVCGGRRRQLLWRGLRRLGPARDERRT